MEAKSKFQRSFLIFENEDSGYEAGQKPTGYVKMEARDGKGRMWASAQNLKPLREGLSYELYLLRTGASSFAAGRAGLLAAGNNGYSIELEFDPLSFAGSGLRMADMDTAVVLVKSKDRPSGSVVCPLAAYRNSKTNWRGGMADMLMRGSQASPRPSEKIDSYPVRLESKFKPKENEASFNIHEASFQKFYETKMPESASILPEMDGILADAREAEKELLPPEADEFLQPTPWAEEPGETGEAEEPGEVEEQWSEPDNEGEEERGDEEQEGPLDMPQDGEQGDMEEEESSGQQYENNSRSQEYSPPAYEHINTDCMYMNGNLCGMRMHGGEGNPCAGCRAYHASVGQEKKEKIPGDINKLIELLNRYFEKSDPFNSQRSDYTWWKVANPVNLNNMLYECGIRSPLLFNPAVMMSHYKYRHLIIGIYMDRQQRQEYLVCGVPGMHMVDKKPFTDMCRWVQLEGSRPMYGAFGYWLVYIEPKTGKLLNIR